MKKLVSSQLVATVAMFATIASAPLRESAAHVALAVSLPVSHPVASPTAARNQYSWNQLSGAWGEDQVEQSLKLRGFQEVYEVKSPGGQGIDRLAIKRAPSGEVIDVKFAEVKTHRGAVARLGTTKVGRQMSRLWLTDKLRAMRNSPDPHTRKMAKEVSAFRKAAGVPIERLGELHDLNTRTGQYVLRDPLSGTERARTSIDRLLRQIQRRATSRPARQYAVASLAALDQIRMTSRGEWISGSGLPAVRVHRRVLLQSASRTATVTAGAKPLQKIVRAAGPIGAAVAVASESYGIYSDVDSYRRGEISRRQFVTVSVRRGGGIAGAAAGAATGAWIGSFGGPVVWITVPAGAGAGGVVGYVAGSAAAGAAAEAWYTHLDEVVQKGLDQWIISTPYASLMKASYE